MVSPGIRPIVCRRAWNRDAAFSAAPGWILSGRTYAGRVLPVLRYSLLRFGLFAACLGVLYLLGARGILLVLLAAAISLALSYVLLARQRGEMARLLAERAAPRPGAVPRGRFARGIAEDAAVEDASVWAHDGGTREAGTPEADDAAVPHAAGTDAAVDDAAGEDGVIEDGGAGSQREAER